ncbi:MAG: hypothetical protein EBW81_10540 [Gammaproteobacteria bacterium]|nr:hypothetical protein [Gammaproteobacteria bacterium]
MGAGATRMAGSKLLGKTALGKTALDKAAKGIPLSGEEAGFRQLSGDSGQQQSIRRIKTSEQVLPAGASVHWV